MTPDQEVVWVAAILEGEGCFSPHRYLNTHTLATGERKQYSYCYPRIECSMTDEDVMLRLSRIMGVKLYGPYGPYKNSRSKIQWRVCVVGAKAREWYGRLLPYMGERRAARMREVLDVAAAGA